jgi:low affinity Fe/Cu permease
MTRANGRQREATARNGATRSAYRREQAAEKAAAGGPVNITPADRFRQIADRITRSMGSPIALLSAVILIGGWAITGPIFGFSDSWQLVINTTTTIITFLMVFVIQASQNRDARAIQLKLDELIRAHETARNELMTTEKVAEKDLVKLEKEFERTAEGKPVDRSRRTRAIKRTTASR